MPNSIIPLIFSLAHFAYAGISPASGNPTDPNDYYTNPFAGGPFSTVDSVPTFLLALVDVIFLIAVPIIVICIIYAGFVFVTAGGNETQIAKARTILVWTLIGAAVLLGAKAIALAIQGTICSLDSTYSSTFC